MTTLTRSYRFCAAHRLHSQHLSESENDRTYGKCNNPHGHGHDYVLSVSVTGEIDDRTGLIVSLSALDRLVADKVLLDFSYRNLNTDVAEFASLVPTTENITQVIAKRLTQHWNAYFPRSAALLTSVSVQETDRNSFEVRLPRAVIQFPAIESNESVIVNA